MTDSATEAVIRQRIAESIALKEALLSDRFVDLLGSLANRLVTSIRGGAKVILFGNGGSAADSMHLAAEFVGRFAFDRGPLPALSLSDNVAAVTAIANDYDYELTFARQLNTLGCPGDVAIALSTSGSSPNVLAGMRAARARGMFTAAFTGTRGTRMAEGADLAIMVPSDVTARIQEGYMLCAHIVCELVEQELFAPRERTRLVSAA